MFWQFNLTNLLKFTSLSFKFKFFLFLSFKFKFLFLSFLFLSSFFKFTFVAVKSRRYNFFNWDKTEVERVHLQFLKRLVEVLRRFPYLLF